MSYTHKQLLKMHGKKCTCKIEGEQITDARIAVEDNKVYVCQNEMDGFDIKDKLGYKYSWIISSNDDHFENNNEYVTDLKIKDRTIKDGLIEEDIIVDEHGDERMVLGVCGRAYFISDYNNFTECHWGYTLEELIECGYKLKQEEPKDEKHFDPMEEIDNLIKIANELKNKFNEE